MLISKHNLKGISLVEIMITIAIVAILFAASAPSFSNWIQNTKIRTAAESIQNGLSLARSEAVHRNLTAQFVTCGSNASWDIIVASATASTRVCDSVLPSAGWLSVQRARTNASGNVLMVNPQTTIGFNGLGRQISTTDLVNGGTTVSPPVVIDINVSATVAGAACTCPAGNCGYPDGIGYASTGNLRCLRISVKPGGQVRMCDPLLAPGTPQGC